MRSFFKKKDGGWKNALLKIKIRKKMPAFTLVATSLAVLTWILIAQSFAMMSSGAMDTAKTQRVTAQAVEAAKLDEAALRNIAYDEIDEKGPHGRRPIEGMDDGSWESSVTIAPERTLSDGERTKVKMATIQIFRTGDTVSRFSLEVPLVSPDFNVKNDDEKHRISQQYDETHKTVDTVVDRKVIYDNVKNDTSNHRISEKYDEETKSVKTYVDGKETEATVPTGYVPLYTSVSTNYPCHSVSYDRSKFRSFQTFDRNSGGASGGSGNYGYCHIGYSYITITGMTGSGYLNTEWFGNTGSKPDTKSIIYGYKHGIDPREAYVVGE